MSQLSLYLKYLVVALMLLNCKALTGKATTPHVNDAEILFHDNYIKVEKSWDEESKTFYFLSRVKHKDERGVLLKLKLDTTIFDLGEAVVDFAHRKSNPIIAINASTGLLVDNKTRLISPGITIIESTVIRDRIPSNYTFGIKANNELVAYPRATSPQAMIDDGIINGFSVFTPLIENYQAVSADIIGLVDNQIVKHPRQVIAQYENLDLLMFSCGGRGFDGEGMKATDIIRILQGLEDRIRFAHNLDGGGSTTTVVYGDQITKMIDQSGTQNRLRPTFLYVEPNDSSLLDISNIDMGVWKDPNAVPDGFGERGKTDDASYLGYLSKATEKFNGMNTVKMTYATSSTGTGVYFTTPYVSLNPGKYELTYYVKGSGFIRTVNLIHESATEHAKRSHSPAAPSVSQSPMGSVHNPTFFPDWTKFTVYYTVTAPSMYTLSFTHNNYGANAANAFLLSGIALRKVYETTNALAPLVEDELSYIFSQGRKITIELNSSLNTMLIIRDIMGRDIIKTHFSTSIEVVVPSIGIYLVTVGSKTCKLFVSNN